MTGAAADRDLILSDRQRGIIFTEEIFVNELSRCPPQRHWRRSPMVVLIPTVPGGPDRYMAKQAKRQLDARGGAVEISADLLTSYHKGNTSLDADVQADVTASADSWVDALHEQARELGVDVVARCPAADPEQFMQRAKEYSAARYWVRVDLPAVSQEDRHLAELARYSDTVRQAGHGSLATLEDHDTATAGLNRIAEEIDYGGIHCRSHVHTVNVVRHGTARGNTLAPDGSWRERPFALPEVQRPNRTVMDPATATQFTGRLDYYAREHPELKPLIAEIRRGTQERKRMPPTAAPTRAVGRARVPDAADPQITTTQSTAANTGPRHAARPHHHVPQHRGSSRGGSGRGG
jgi:hypothetical protein